MPDGNSDKRFAGKTVLVLLTSAAVLVSALTWNQIPLFNSTPMLPEGYTNCNAAHFSTIGVDSIPGTKRLALSASPVYNYSEPPAPFGFNNTDKPYFNPDLSDLSFCNVTFTYTRPGYHNRVNVYVYLPTQADWNGRFQGVGGGGYVTGMGELELLPAVATGWAAASSTAPS